MHERLDRADIDDASLAGAQGRQERMRHVEDAGEVDRDDVFPVLDHVIGRAQHAVAADDAGIVDEDRDLSDLVGDLFRHRDAIFAVRDVERKTFGLGAGVADFPRSLRRRLLIPVEQHHAGALAGIAVRDGAPDAGACTGDDGDVILEKWHGAFPLLLILAEDSKRAGAYKMVARIAVRRWAKRKRAHHLPAGPVMDGGHVASAPLPTLRNQGAERAGVAAATGSIKGGLSEFPKRARIC
jgi:hypothetical protein